MAVYAAQSERLLLQRLNVEDHLQGCFALMSIPEAMFWSRGQPHTDPQQTLEVMPEWMPTPEKPWNERWAIMLRPTSKTSSLYSKRLNGEEADGLDIAKLKMIGLVGTPRQGELAYKIHPDYWGKGYMSETLTMFLKLFWAMEVNRHLDRIIAGADPENLASTKVLQKAGFQKSEYKKEFYERGVYEGVRKSDLQFFFLMRPSD